MPIKPLFRTAEYPYHVVNRANNRDQFELDLNELWQIFIDCFGRAKELYACDLHSFVLMPNHFHLMVSTPNENLDLVMQYVQREVSRTANRKTKRINHFFGSRYKWSAILEEEYFSHVHKYIFRNPVKAGLCHLVTDYSFSSLNTKPTSFDWELTDFLYQPKKITDIDFEWLNLPTPAEEEESIRRALRRSKFKLPKDVNGKPFKLSAPHPKKVTNT